MLIVNWVIGDLPSDVREIVVLGDISGSMWTTTLQLQI